MKTAADELLAALDALRVQIEPLARPPQPCKVFMRIVDECPTSAPEALAYFRTLPHDVIERHWPSIVIALMDELSRAELLGIMRAIQMRLPGAEPAYAMPRPPNKRGRPRMTEEQRKPAVERHVSWAIETMAAHGRVAMGRLRNRSGPAIQAVVDTLLGRGYRIEPGLHHGEAMVPPQDSPLPTSESCPQGAPDGPDPAESP